MGAISGALSQLQATFDLDETQQEWLVSILYIGGGLGASVGGSICDLAGRKLTIILTDVVFILGAAWLFFARSYGQVLVGRFVVGVGVAVSGVADVSYLHECAPIEWRGSIVSVNEACISLGFLLAYIAGYFFSNAENEEWRTIFGLAGIVALIQMVGMFQLPESPAWLYEKGKIEAARKAFLTINCALSSSTTGAENVTTNDSVNPVLGRQEVANETAASNAEAMIGGLISGNINPGELVSTVQGGLMEQDQAIPQLGTYQHPRTEVKPWLSIPTVADGNASILSKLHSALLVLSRYRRQTYIAIFLAVTQQFCGQTIVLNYAPMIFSEAAKKDFEDGNANGDEVGEAPDWSTIAIGLTKFLVTVLVILRIEYVGRRILLLAGTSLIAIGLLALIIAFGGSKADTNESAWSPLTNLKTFHLALPGVLLVVCGYSMSFGPLTWLLTSELFPTDIRGRALGFSTIVTYCCAALVTRTFLSAQSILGPSKVFAVYCIITMFGVLFEYLAIPDTGERTVEEIDKALAGMYWWRFDSIVLSQVDQDLSTTGDGSKIDLSPPTSQFSLPDLT
jgi:MFS family permease